jgi:GNAT superfamily N-acetyltransferase
MASPMKYRTAEISDASDISELIYLTSLQCCFTPSEPCPLWFENSIAQPVIEAQLRTGSVSYLLAESAREIVGVLGVSGGHFVKYFFVHPLHQGYGIGKHLWQMALGLGLLGKKVSVRSSLVAVPVYKRLGFSVVEPPKVFNGLHYQSMVAIYD